MMLLASLRIVDLSTCSLVVPSSTSVHSLIAKYIALKRYPLQDDLVGSAKGGHGYHEGLQNRQGISKEDDNAGSISAVLCMGFFCLEIGGVQTDSKGNLFFISSWTLYVDSPLPSDCIYSRVISVYC